MQWGYKMDEKWLQILKDERRQFGILSRIGNIFITIAVSISAILSAYIFYVYILKPFM